MQNKLHLSTAIGEVSMFAGWRQALVHWKPAGPDTVEIANLQASFSVCDAQGDRWVGYEGFDLHVYSRLSLDADAPAHDFNIQYGGRRKLASPTPCIRLCMVATH